MNQALSFLDNYLNPLFLRELRRLVRNRFIIVLINLFIAALVLVSVLTVLFQETGSRSGVGGSLFGGLTAVMVITCFLAVVVYTATTTATERIDGDLMYSSAMKPSAIVLGKAWSGAVLTLLFLCITAPFVTLAYLLRGLDIEWVALAFLYIFVGIQVLNAVTICVSCNVKSKTQQSLILGGSIIGLIVVVLPMIQMLFVSTRFGSGVDPWWMAAIHFLMALALLSICLAAATATISPPASNRMLPLRVTVTTLYLGSLLFCWLFPAVSAVGDTVEIWLYGWGTALFPLMLLVVCERDQWSYRIKKAVPKNVLLRILAFPFYTGSPNGIVWIVLLASGVLSTAIWIISMHDGHIAPFLLLFDYCVTALLLRAFFLRRWIQPEKTWVLALLLLLLFTLGSMLAFFLVEFNEVTNGDFWRAYESSYFMMLNPFMNENGPAGTVLAMSGLVWAALLALPLLAWFVRTVRWFSPFSTTGTMTLEEAEAAVRDADANPLVQSERERERKLRADTAS